MVQIRGGGGSGKSTLVRNWCDEHGGGVKFMMENAAGYGLGHIDCPKSRPFALQFQPPHDGLNLPAGGVTVPGHYESTGGGCDMIASTKHIYEVVEKAMSFGSSILMEGLFVSKDIKDARASFERLRRPDTEIYVILLEVPEEQAYASVQQRRVALGKPERFLKSHHGDYRSIHVSNRPHYQQLIDEGLIKFEEMGRIAAAERVRELLG